MTWLSSLLPFLRTLPSFVEDEHHEDHRVPETIVSPDSDPKMPIGKGIYVQTIDKATIDGTGAALAARAKDLRLSWVALLVLWQHSDRDRFYARVDAAAQACRSAGIDVWVWGWPEHAVDRRSVFIDTMAHAIETTQAKGIIMNVEAPYYGASRAKDASALAQGMRAAVGPQIPLGVATYGLPTIHPRFPLASFVGHTDFGMPEIYDSKHDQGPLYPQRCIEAWHKLGFERLVPTWGASKQHTAAQMREMIERTPKQPGASWWDMNWLRSSTQRAAVVREMDWYDKA